MQRTELVKEITRLMDRRVKNKKGLYQSMGLPVVVERMSHNAYLHGAVDILKACGLITNAEALEIIRELMIE